MLKMADHDDLVIFFLDRELPILYDTDDEPDCGLSRSLDSSDGNSQGNMRLAGLFLPDGGKVAKTLLASAAGYWPEFLFRGFAGRQEVNLA